MTKVECFPDSKALFTGWKAAQEKICEKFAPFCVNRVVARASRPCDPKLTAGTPVPLCRHQFMSPMRVQLWKSKLSMNRVGPTCRSAPDARQRVPTRDMVPRRGFVGAEAPHGPEWSAAVSGCGDSAPSRCPSPRLAAGRRQNPQARTPALRARDAQLGCVHARVNFRFAWAKLAHARIDCCHAHVGCDDAQVG